MINERQLFHMILQNHQEKVKVLWSPTSFRGGIARIMRRKFTLFYGGNKLRIPYFQKY
jgi:hypothetical protein